MMRHKKQVHAKQVIENRRSAACMAQIELKIDVHDGQYARYVRILDAHPEPQRIRTPTPGS
jgi:hypothetical protein